MSNSVQVNYNPDVLTCLANLSNDEVFTPPELVNQILNMLPTDLWQNKDAKFLDPVTKSGVFLREIAKRLNVGLAGQIPDQQTRLNHIFKNQLYGIAITELTSLLARRSVYCSKKANSQLSICTEFDNGQGNILFDRIQHTWQSSKCIYCGASQEVYSRSDDLESHAYQFIHTDKPQDFFGTDMKFDVIVGNPPYQLSDGGAQASASPIYHKFIQQAKKLNPHFLIMIAPSRWFTGGKGLDEFRNEMLSDRHIKEIHDFPNASDCFTGVEIKGGVNYFVRDSHYLGDCLISTYENGKPISVMQRPLREPDTDAFIRYNEAISIYRKILSFQENSFSNCISSRKPFGLTTNIKGNTEPYANTETNVKLYQNKGIGYIERQNILINHEWIGQHKVLIPYAVGSGDSRTDRVKSIYAAPNTACTETYLVLGPFVDKKTCENVMSYIETRFLHFMLTLKKNTQHATAKVYQFVPMQDFSESWTDEKLYKKYGLTAEEITFIESMIRPMELKDE